MAEMIPRSLAASEDATTGEHRVFTTLRDSLVPDEDFIVWYEPKTARRRPDFLIWSRTWGLLVVEVKDWTIGSIVGVSTDQWRLRRQGLDQVFDSPIEQARKCFLGFKDLLQQSTVLRHTDGLQSGRLKFPIGYCAIFTRMTREQAKAAGLLAVMPPDGVLFSEEFFLPPTDATLPFRLRHAFPVRFPFTPLREVELQTLRSLIFPEVRLTPRRPTATALRSAEQDALLHALDLEQEQVAKSITTGHHLLKGVAGSGKTLVLACRAKYLHLQHPDWRILVVCFNISLGHHLRQLTAVMPDDQRIEVTHYHGLVKRLTRANLGRLPSETDEDYDLRVGELLTEGIEGGSVSMRYDAILIDEGQDFTAGWIRSLIALLNPATDSLLFSIDPAQNIFGRKISYKSLGIRVQGRRPHLLHKSYRNTSEILALARRFSGVTVALPAAEEEESLESSLFPMDMERRGQTPSIIDARSPADQIQFILDEISRLVAENACARGDIGVLYVDHASTNFAKALVAAWNGRFLVDDLYWVTASRENKLNLDLSTDSVKLSTIESSKGLEFRVVFLIGLDRLPRHGRDEVSERKLAYVGLTRAQDALYVLGHTRQGLFAGLIDKAVPNSEPA